MEHLEEAIRERAYHLWTADGRPEGKSETYWLSAQHEMLMHSVDRAIAKPSTSVAAKADKKAAAKKRSPKKPTLEETTATSSGAATTSSPPQSPAPGPNPGYEAPVASDEDEHVESAAKKASADEADRSDEPDAA